MLTHFSLFSGIGGIDLAAEWAGFETVGQCEWADYPTKVLEKHWPDVPRWRDIRSVTAESYFDRTGLRTVDLVSGGFPCQPFSVAGKQRGKGDDRYLWPEMLRVIQELRPTWVIGENVAGIINMALDQVLADLDCFGYKTQPFVIPACGVGAHHRRDRVWIIAVLEHAADNGQPELRTERRCSTESALSRGSCRPQAEVKVTGQHTAGTSASSKDVADALCNGGATWLSEPFDREKGYTGKFVDHCYQPDGGPDNDNWTFEPSVGRVANGVPSRVDRLKCLGNAVVPQQVYPILAAIAEIEQNQSRGEPT